MRIERTPSSHPVGAVDIAQDFIARRHEQFLAKSDKYYWYWDELKYRPGLPYESPEQTWFLIKFHRKQRWKKILLGNYTFRYCDTSEIYKNLYEFDTKQFGELRENPISETDKQLYLKNSLQEEAIASSQIEGAATTTQQAWEMLKRERKPKNEGEQMIFNNQRAIRFIIERHKESLSPELIVELHSILTAKTSAEACSGDFRKTLVNVVDHVDGEIAYVAPNASEVSGLVQSLCEFANTDAEFIHPILKASMLHFLIGFIHPFLDGNGRTARALFYWFMMKKEYSLIKHISISRAILDSRTQYDKAFLKTEYDDNDMTYFLMYSIKGLRVAFESLVRFRDRKRAEYLSIDNLRRTFQSNGNNERQALVLAEMRVKQALKYSVNDYADKFGITRQTAAKDLSGLVKNAGVIEQSQGRNKFYFLPKN